MLNLLVIDDDVTFIEVLQRRLQRTEQFQVSVYTSLEQALAAPAQVVHGILLDMMLLEGSGLDGIAPLKAKFAPKHLIMLTGYASIATTVEAMRRGATDYIAKPVGLQELIERLQETPLAQTGAEPKPMTKAQAEWEHIQRVLLANQGNVTLTADALGMHRRSLQRKLQKHSPK
ncbi:MAG: response regulator [Paraglaciecola sp.]|uniref:response regulator transcription factor n=1 Tax=Pseudomonadati TaxID=3379134 RepID=UPI00273D5967|nr:response regulator [Paraglaciecola sp.]MDP5029175.1 response regulator [Paraglaciecola sp.]MDP5129372.1 response regulator [Paraglaciecola sp.]